RVRSNTTGCDVTACTSANNSFQKFVRAWETYDVIIYFGHANMGIDLDIHGENEHCGSGVFPFFPKLRKQLKGVKIRTRLFCALSCNSEVPYCMTDAVTKRIRKDYRIRALGHRRHGKMGDSFKEIVRVIEAIVHGKKVWHPEVFPDLEGQKLTGLELVPHLTSEHVGTQDGMTDKEFAERHESFQTDGTTIFYHQGLNRFSWATLYGPRRYFLFTVDDLIKGAQGKCLEDHFLDDEVVSAPYPSENSVVVDSGENKHLETIPQGDDRYNEDHTAILAGKNKKCDSPTTGAEAFVKRMEQEIGQYLPADQSDKLTRTAVFMVKTLGGRALQKHYRKLVE
ncbi:MAG: hypothetical protein ACOC7K_02165, partial [bacterium]